MYSIISSSHIDNIDFGPQFKVSHIVYKTEKGDSGYVVISEKSGKNKRVYYVKHIDLIDNVLLTDIDNKVYPYSTEKEAHRIAKLLASE